jgi:hypothetical protein
MHFICKIYRQRINYFVTPSSAIEKPFYRRNKIILNKALTAQQLFNLSVHDQPLFVCFLNAEGLIPNLVLKSVAK